MHLCYMTTTGVTVHTQWQPQCTYGGNSNACAMAWPLLAYISSIQRLSAISLVNLSTAKSLPDNTVHLLETDSRSSPRKLSRIDSIAQVRHPRAWPACEAFFFF